jgi:hypothetical protein
MASGSYRPRLAQPLPADRRCRDPVLSRDEPLSASVAALNGQGDQGWEAVGMTSLADGTVAVLMKRPRGADASATL